jgi:hypothetical protein
MCIVDDAQWLDRASAQALAFVARRLQAESVLMMFAMRELSTDFDGLPELAVDGLSDADARELLDSVVRWPLDDRVAARIVTETNGNPLALLELPRDLSPQELAGGFGLPDALPLSGKIEQSFLRRAESLPEDTRLLLVLAAAEPTGDAALMWRAAGLLGLRVAAADYAEATGLLEVGTRVRFRHPLVRSAVYRGASASDRKSDRKKVHAALAEVADPDVDPDRRAWHRAQAAPAPDEDVAADLERSADRAQARGGLAAAAAFLERSADLTVDAARQAGRALAAWQGRAAEANQLFQATMDAVAPRGEGMGLCLAQYTSAVLNNGLGRYAAALDAAGQASAYPQELGFANWGLAELVEAAARSGDTARAARAVEQLTRTTRHSGTRWDQGIEGRSRALISDDDDAAELLYREAIEQLGRCRGAVALAVLISSTGNGSDARTGKPTPGSSCGPPTRCSPRCRPRRSPTALAASCWQPGRRSAGVPSRRAMS